MGIEGSPAVTAEPTAKVDVVLLRLPVSTYVAVKQRNDELMREFALIAHSDADVSASIPARLVDVVEQVRSRFGVFTDATTDAIFDAHERGEDHVDAVYTLPADVAAHAVDAATTLSALYDEADEFCRSGDLLALAPPEEFVRLRHWFFDEFRRQLSAGQPPTPYDEYAR